VIVFTVPMAHLRGIPTRLRERYDVPVVFYDGDVPMSLPEFGGMDTGFNWYHQSDPSEYDFLVSNSDGVSERLLDLGSRRAETIFWGADPEFFAPHAVEKSMDVFFYGYGDKFRRDWMQAMVGEPSRVLPDADFALGGRDFKGDIGGARQIGDVRFVEGEPRIVAQVCEVERAAGAEVVDDADLVAVVQQALDHVAPDEAGAASDQCHS